VAKLKFYIEKRYLVLMTIQYVQIGRGTAHYTPQHLRLAGIWADVSEEKLEMGLVDVAQGAYERAEIELAGVPLYHQREIRARLTVLKRRIQERDTYASDITDKLN
jgi:hypothetical protein